MQPSPEDEAWRPLPFLMRTIPAIVAKQRFLAYASEVGESFRPIIPVSIVYASYAASLFYVGADVSHHFHQLKGKGTSRSQLLVQTGDKLIWHGFASMLFPALSVHSIVSYSGKAMDRVAFFKSWPRVRTWSPTALALASIPFIIHPLDHLTDFLMDNSLRRLYPQ